MPRTNTHEERMRVGVLIEPSGAALWPGGNCSFGRRHPHGITSPLTDGCDDRMFDRIRCPDNLPRRLPARPY